MIESVGPTPWARVKDPWPLPEPVNPVAMQRYLADIDDNTLGRLIRDHLLPPADQSLRPRWRALWNALTLDPDLRRRADRILDEFLDQAESTLDRDEPDPAATKRIEAFYTRCADALDRIDHGSDDTRPMAWAGAAAAQHNPRSQQVIDELVTAIARHHGDHDNAALWGTLDAVLRQMLGPGASVADIPVRFPRTRSSRHRS